ncbi:MAG: RHS repeat-associated core domain-containing protein [Serratia sp. (in: enterobacteria)]|uniref:RHS repeat-associated core domain-containing protein n=1 Tax=Serratia sp. (in: enterobacteria) TaxID=616 RepID=UPI003F3C1DA0
MVAECADDDNIFTADAPKPAHLATYKSYLYTPGSFVQLAQLLGKGRKSEIYYYLTDHLSTPQELVNGNLAVAFVNSVPQPLRFQGQYHDVESGLHYNRYRYYSPETARFITPDPIGLAGGLNQTQYVPNPTGWVDPLGLASVPGGCPPNSDIQAGVKTGEPEIPATGKFKWGNPKSTPTYGHTFADHGQKLKPNQLIDRARGKGHQVGQYVDDNAAANFIADVAGKGPGVHNVPLPKNVTGRGYLPNGVELKPDGSVRTSFPYDTAHPN